MIEHKCLTCKWAVWGRTKSGRLHPNKQGVCRWTTALKLPASLEQWDLDAMRMKIRLKSERSIWRDEIYPHCDTYEEQSA